MLTRLKEKYSRDFLGTLIKDWGSVFEKRGKFFSEQTNLALYRDNEEFTIVLSITYKSRLSYNKLWFEIPVADLENFISELRVKYDELRRFANNPHPRAPRAADKIPLFGPGFLIRIMHGIKTSKLLMDFSNPDKKKAWYRFHGYISRKSEMKVLIQSDIDVSMGRGTVIAGESLDAVLHAVSEFIRERRR